MNPDSESLVELGTKTHPYKNLGYVFVELLNYHSHQDRNISIYVKEYTQNYVYLFNSFIVNITHVEIMSYSDDDTVTPGKPIITALENEELTDTRGTSLNILQNYEMRTSQAITDNPNVTVYERFVFEQGGCVFMIIRSNFYMDNFELKTEYESLLKNRYFFLPINLQHRLIKLMNLDFRIGGSCLGASDPLNIHLENIDVDYSRNLGGFYVSINCMYPEAEIDTLFYLK